MKYLVYKYRSVGSLDSLARALNISVTKLRAIAVNSEDFYVPNEPFIKPNGHIRQTYSVKEPLHSLQKNILRKIISGVEFPEYLQGSIKDPNSPRDYVRDANLHAGQEINLKEDISSFFSSTRVKLVYSVWKYFFNFPYEVAEVLTSLTTYKDFVPEGAPTSPAIANLVFWDREPELEYALRKKSYVYSRYVDDITVSSSARIEKKELESITTKIYGMFISAGLKPNRSKRKVQTKNTGMVVHNLNTSSGRSTLPKSERFKIRAAVKELEILAQSADSWENIKKYYDEVSGRVNSMKRLHEKEAQKYIVKLKDIREQILSRKDTS